MKQPFYIQNSIQSQSFEYSLANLSMSASSLSNINSSSNENCGYHMSRLREIKIERSQNGQFQSNKLCAELHLSNFSNPKINRILSVSKSPKKSIMQCQTLIAPVNKFASGSGLIQTYRQTPMKIIVTGKNHESNSKEFAHLSSSSSSLSNDILDKSSPTRTISQRLNFFSDKYGKLAQDAANKHIQELCNDEKLVSNKMRNCPMRTTSIPVKNVSNEANSILEIRNLNVINKESSLNPQANKTSSSSTTTTTSTIINNFMTKKTNLVDQNLLGNNSGNLRKDFLQKQQSIRKAAHHQQQQEQNTSKILIVNNKNYKGEYDSSQNKQQTMQDSESDIKFHHQPIIVNRTNSLSTSKRNSSRLQQLTGTTATTPSQQHQHQQKASVKINFESFKNQVNENKENQAQKEIMVNIPLAPKKCHTFSEKEAPSHKDSSSKLLLETVSENTNAENATNPISKNNTDVIYFHRPLVRTGSNLTTSSSQIVTKSKSATRKPPREFLSSNSPTDLTRRAVSPSPTRPNRANEGFQEVTIHNYSNSRASPIITKSLPSYDEALKRVNGETKVTKIHVMKSSLSPICMNGATSSKFINNNNNIGNNINNSSSLNANKSSEHINALNAYTTSNTSAQQQTSLSTATVRVGNKNSAALPVIPMQSTFKSLLSIPINNSSSFSTSATGSNAANAGQTTTMSGIFNSKVYFKPQDLNSANRFATPSASNNNQKSSSSTSTSDKVKTELYLIQKNTSDRLFNGLPAATTPNSTKLQSTTRKFMMTPKQPPMPTVPLISTLTAENNANNEKESSKRLSGIFDTPGVNVEGSDSRLSFNNKPTAPSINTPTSTSITMANNDYVTTKTLTTMTTTTTEHINTIIRRTPSPACALTSSSTSSQQKLKSWSNSSPPLVQNTTPSKHDMRSRDTTPDLNKQGVLTNWKSTASASNQSEKQIVIEKQQQQQQSNENVNEPSKKREENASETNEPCYSTLNPNELVTATAKPNAIRTNSMQLISSGKLLDAIQASNAVDESSGLINTSNKMDQLLLSANNKQQGSKTPIHSLINNNNNNNGKVANFESAIGQEEHLSSNKKQDSSSTNHKSNNKKNKQSKLIDTNASDTSALSSSSYTPPLIETKTNSKRSARTSNAMTHKETSLLNDARISVKSSSETLSHKAHKNQAPSIASTGTSQEKVMSHANKQPREQTSSPSDNQTNKIKEKHSSTANEHANVKKFSATSNDATSDRPPCRLNYYDSDSNTISEGPSMHQLVSKKSQKSSTTNSKKARKGELLTDSPDLSDITEGKFDEIVDNGHRTSTPNMTKHRRSSSLSSNELKTIRMKVEELEKMYFELLRLIEPERQSAYSSLGHSSTSISSFTGSLHDSSNHKRSASFHRAPADNQHHHNHPSQQQPSDISHLKHRFSRMESHLTLLAKTVAQISVEVKSIKSIEDVIYALTREVHELRNLASSNSYSNLQKSSSEPNINKILSKMSHRKSSSNQMGIENEQDEHEVEPQEDEAQSTNNNLNSNSNNVSVSKAGNGWLPTYSNPKKIKKLTKFFGQEPPLLRLFLQKLNYEVYAKNFENEHITMTELPYLSEEGLKLLGIPLGPRLRILREAQLTFQKDFHSNLLNSSQNKSARISHWNNLELKTSKKKK